MAEHFPAPWDVDRLTATVYATDVPKGPARVADMRGWGYLTGKGHGALSLSEDEAIDIQRANAEHIIKCVNSHLDLVKALDQTRTALDAMKFAVEASGKLNDRGYISLGIQVNNALDKAGAILSRVGSAPVSEGEK